MMVFLHTLRNHPLGLKLGTFVPVEAWEKRPSVAFSLCAFTLLASLLLGGGTRGGFLSDAILELIAIPVFLLTLTSLIATPWKQSNRSAAWALLLCCAIALLPLLQLIPLPPWVWERLPHRQDMIMVFGLVGRQPPWLPISVAPNGTWLSALSLLPPLAVFLGVIQLNYRERRLMSLFFLAVGVVAAMVGLLQVAQGSSSPLRFFALTNQSEAVGFFANRNHFAALLYVLVMFASAWATEAAFTAGSWRDLRSLQSSSFAVLTASLLVLIVVMAAETITRSRAGLGLMIIGMFGGIALPLSDRRRTAGAAAVKLMVGAVAVVTLLAVQFALYRILDSFALDPLEGARPIFAKNTITAAMAYMPFGSGFGTFMSIYPMFERAQDTLANTYANHAHNDFLEVWLEGGIGAVAILAGFLCWFVLRLRAMWSRPARGMREIDVLLGRAATVAIGLTIAHCFVDYPLRTDAMMAALAFCCALLIEPLGAASNEMTDRHRIAAAASDKPALPVVASPGAGVPHDVSGPPGVLPRPVADAPRGAPARPVEAGQWGEDIDWPEQWRK